MQTRPRREERREQPFTVTLVCSGDENADSVQITVEIRRLDTGKYQCQPIGWDDELVGVGDTIGAAEVDFKSRLKAHGIAPEQMARIAYMAGKRLDAERHPHMSGSERRGYVRGAEELERLSDLIWAFAVGREPPMVAESPPLSDREVLLLAAERLYHLGPSLGAHVDEIAGLLRNTIDELDASARLTHARKHRQALESRLAAEGATSTSDEELVRCLSGVVLPTAMIECARVLRDAGELSVAPPLSEQDVSIGALAVARMKERDDAGA